MPGTLGTIRGQMVLDVRQAIAAYTAARLANLQTVTAMRTGAGALAGVGAGMAAVGLGLLAGIKMAIDAASQFERKMDFFGAVTAATTDQMEAARAKAIELGQDTIFSAGQIADAFVELGKSGVTAEQIIGGIGEAVTNLGAAADIPLDTAANIMMSAVQTFHLGAEQAVGVADLLAGAANASIVEVEDLGTSLKYAGGVAASLGMPINDVVDALALLGTYGLRGSTAGTSLRQILVSLGGATKAATSELKDLGIITEDGSNKFFDATGSAKPLAEIFQILQDATAGMGDEAKLAALKTIFQNRALASAIALTDEGAAGFARMNEEIGKTTAMEVAGKRLDNLSGDVEVLKGNLETLAIEQGSQLQEFMRGLVQGLTAVVQWFANLDAGTQQWILRAVAITGIILVILGAFALFASAILNVIALFTQLAPVFKLLFSGVKLLVTGFRLLSVAMLTNPVGLIILAIVALVAAFILLWKNVEGFRNFFIAAWDWIKNAAQSTVDWFKGLPGWFSEVWDGITEGATNGWNAVLDFFRSIPGMLLSFFLNFTLIGLLIQHWDSIKATAISVWESIIAYVSSIPERMAAFFAALPGRIGYFIGFLMGTLVRFFFDLGVNVYAAIVSGWQAMIDWFQALPARVGNFFSELWSTVTHWVEQTAVSAILWALNLRDGIEQFWRELPDRAGKFFSQLWDNITSWLSRTYTSAVARAGDIVNGILNWFQALPGRVGSFFNRVATSIGDALIDAWHTANRLAQNIGDGVIDALQALPGLVSGIFNRVVEAIRGQIRSAINAVTDFASGLWEGFKDGLGIHSPSYIERAMWQITGVVADETDKLAGMVPRIQGIAEDLSNVGFNNQFTGDYAVSAVAQLADEMSRLQKVQNDMSAISSNIDVASNARSMMGATSGFNNGAPAAPVMIDRRQYIDVDVDAPQSMSPDQVGKMVASRVGYALSSNTTPIPTPASAG